MVARPSHLVDAKRASQACEHRLEGKELIVTLPKWRQAPAAEASIGRGVVVNAAPVNRTSELMGDPPRGRSALDQRSKR